MGGAIFQGTFSIGGNAVPNVTGISFDDAAADIVSRVVGDTVDTHYAGTRNFTGTVNCELAAASASTIANFVPGTTGAVIINIFGSTSTYLSITSTDGVMLSINESGQVNGIGAFTMNFALNDATYGSVA